MRAPIASLWILSFASMCAGTVALAAPAAVAPAEDPQRAKELFQQGTTFFDLGQFDKAIESWQEGYKAKPDPGFLYNIAQAYRLAGDAPKAIFFYRGYLRNSPKAHNRAEVEQKIAALQKQVGDPERNKLSPPPSSGAAAGAGAVSPPPPATPQPYGAAPPPSPPPSPSPPPVTTSPPPEPQPAAPPPFAAPPGPPVVSATEAPAAAAPSGERPFDLAAGLGSDFWTSGLHGTAQPSFALTLAAGYTFGRSGGARVRFHLGALFGYTFLSEPSSKETFTSFLINPGARIRLTSTRFFLTADLGLGVLAINGLKPGSSLLAPGETVTITGAQGMSVIRPAVGLEYQLTPALWIFASTAIASSPKKAYFYGPISRSELLFGLACRL